MSETSLDVPEVLADAVRRHQAGELEEAERLYRQVLAADPHHADGLHLLGLLGHQTGRHDLSIDMIQQAIGINARQALYHANLGTVLREQKRLDEAVTAYRTALQLRPDDAGTLSNLGLALQEQGLLRAAAATYQTVCQLTPDAPVAHYNLGNALKEQGKLQEAVACYRRAIELMPDYPAAFNNLGNALKDLGRLDAAAVAYRRAIKLKPDYPVALNNLGYVLSEQEQFDAAVACYRNAIEFDADFPQAHLNLATLLLARGDMAPGWQEYEWRWKMPHAIRDPDIFARPQWQGEAAEGQTLLIHAEQGIGDTLQFCRYAPLAAERGLRVIVELQRPLLRLLRHLPGVVAVVAAGEERPPFDLHCPMLSMPLALGTTLSSIPSAVSYLRADPVLAEAWGRRLAGMTNQGARIGVAWAGNPGAVAFDPRRSMDPQALMPLFELPGLHVFSLQKEGPAAPADARLTDAMSEMADFADTAALIANLDLVISVDTAVVHLAAAMGKPVWMLDRFDHCWRWLNGRRDSPWYPSLRIYRQPRPGDWAAVVAEVTSELRALIEV